MKKLLLLIVLAVALAIPASAAATKPPPPPPATLTLNPNPVYPYTIYTVTGCGYPHSTALTLEFEDSALEGLYYPEYYAIFSDSSGCLTWPPPYTGTIAFQADGAGSTDEFSIWHGFKFLAYAIETVIPYP